MRLVKASLAALLLGVTTLGGCAVFVIDTADKVVVRCEFDTDGDGYGWGRNCLGVDCAEGDASCGEVGSPCCFAGADGCSTVGDCLFACHRNDGATSCFSGCLATADASAYRALDDLRACGESAGCLAQADPESCLTTSCQSQGYLACFPPPACGDGQRNGTEDCEGNDLGGNDCGSVVTGAIGTLACANDCTFDTSQCTLCGNGTQDAGEECDNGNLNSDTLPDACRTSCVLPSCNDGVCDAGATAEDPANCNADCPSSCGDGLCTTGEHVLVCDSDCPQQSCDIATTTPATAYEYIVSGIVVPTTAAEGATYGADLDGDNNPDNQWGAFAELAWDGFVDPNADIDAQLVAGDFKILGRQYVDQFPSDTSVLGQILEGIGGSPPTLDGTDVVTLAGGARDDLYVCGALTSFAVDSEVGRMRLPVFVLPNAPPVYVVTYAARLQGFVDTAGWTNVNVSGAITPDDVNLVVIPAFLAAAQAEITNSPGGAFATAILATLDGVCDDGVPPGCGGVTPGVAPCEANGALTEEEVRCNAAMQTALAPDLDITGDGTPDLVTFGYRFTAARATIQ